MRFVLGGGGTSLCRKIGQTSMLLRIDHTNRDLLSIVALYHNTVCPALVERRRLLTDWLCRSRSLDLPVWLVCHSSALE